MLEKEKSATAGADLSSEAAPIKGVSVCHLPMQDACPGQGGISARHRLHLKPVKKEAYGQVCCGGLSFLSTLSKGKDFWKGDGLLLFLI